MYAFLLTIFMLIKSQGIGTPAEYFEAFYNN